MTKTIIISNRLPVSIEKKGDKMIYSSSAGGLATGLGSIYKKGNNIWLGWPGLYVTKDKDKEEISSRLREENMAPVFLTKTDIQKFYEGFSNTTLWPLFHYFPKYTLFDDDLWESYKYVNQMFCDETLKYAKNGDIIWIHDYQLLLLPQMIREKLPDATIGFFQHIPFPSFEIFRNLPWRKELLQGMLGADQIGFHTYDDVRHFLSSVSRLVGIDNKMGEMRIQGRICVADCFPMGIDYNKFHSAAQSEETGKEIENYKEVVGKHKIIISIDRLDYSKGIPDRLKAYDLFLEKYPEYKGKVVLLLIVVPSRDQVDLYKKLKIEIDELVGRINGKYGKINWTPIRYFYRSFPFTTLSAMYKLSDVALVTPLRDGMNLVCKEYIASRVDQTGVLILSEMAGAAKELSDALIINPNNTSEMADALYKAFKMPVEEQKRRMEELQDVLKRYDIHNWVDIFMKRLNVIKEKQQDMAVRLLTKDLQNQMMKDYKKANKRVFFLDYDGTLVPFKGNPLMAKPDKELYSLLETLSSDPRNKVVIISGRDKDTLDSWFGHMKIDMISEHGVWLKESRPFWSLIDYITDEWKAEISPILEMFVDRTPGSFIEHKGYSLVWHYRKADPELGELRARELVGHLQFITTNMNIKVLEGNKVIEVKNSGINKGKAALKWLEEPYDFILSAGDDYTDEDMFAVMPESSYSIKIGLSPSNARFNIRACNPDTCEEMRTILRNFAEESEKDMDEEEEDEVVNKKYQFTNKK
ncbi:MAG: bifunctional alpha,alpha-trehalose-phosphate synthase (UDP-forming)/trehalose-phosphatase [Cytophagaceae bacterium]